MKNKNLHNIKNSGFKVPKEYFEGLEATILNKINLKEQFKDSGFKTPDNYFDTVETTILSKVEKPEIKVIPLFNRKTIITVSSIAAAIVLLFNLNLFNSNQTLESIDINLVENYLLEEMEVNDLSLLFDESELLQSDFINYDSIDTDSYIDDIDLNELYQE